MAETNKQKAKVENPEKRIVNEVLSLFRQCNTAWRNKWQADEQKSYDFFLGDQLSQEQKDQLEENNMPTFIINRVQPIIETMIHFVTASKPRWKAVGVDGSDSQLAQIHSDIIDYAWALSSGTSLFSQVVRDALTKSKGYLHIVIDPNADRGMGEVKFERVDPFHVWTAPRSSDILERDANFHIIKKDLTREELLNMLPEFEAKIRSATGQEGDLEFSERDMFSSISIQQDSDEATISSDGELDDKLSYYEVYKPVKVKYYNLFIQRVAGEGELKKIAEIVDNDSVEFRREMEVRKAETIANLEQQLANGDIVKQRFDKEVADLDPKIEASIEDRKKSILAKTREQFSTVEQKVVTAEEYEKVFRKDPSVKDAIPYYESRVKKIAVVGDKLLYEIILNISHTPLIPVSYLHTGTPYPISAAKGLVGKQQEVNKAHQIMVHNANLSSNPRWKYPEGSIDLDLWENGSGPGDLLPYRQLSPGDSGPEAIQPLPINNAFFQIEHESKTDMEYLAGIQPATMGIQGDKDDTFRGFLARDENGTRRIRSWVSNAVEPALEHCGKIFQEMAQDVYSVHKIFRITQPDPNGGQTEKTVEMNIPIYNDKGGEIGRYKDYASSNYDIRIIAGSTLPINRWAMLEEYKQYMQMGVIDDIAFLGETDVPNKEQIMQRKSMIANLTSKVEEMNQAIEDQDHIINNLTKQLIQAGIKEKVNQAEKEIIKSKEELRASDKLFQKRLEDALKLAREDMVRELDKIKDESGARQSEQTIKPSKK